ncbi:alpha/beta hydrolase [Paenibacillus xerothermodurans]|uniref:Esterase family protein n=1 Tax=Paenibacillus xerothermodurans TaxID=1977292 RepID=A0A2W1NEC2_PAEXE|nr:alpha/beta hydrolase family protein [Paenibacillus xerothermodurans]PZE22274.1 esterase family protein [Paenibacillus xerothermodurans]
MALIQCNFFSEALQLSTSMTVILPQQTRTQIGQQNVKMGDRHPTLYLLHGLSDDDTIWLRRTSIERYVAPLGLAVVMPQVHRSWYTDMVHGNRYWTFLSEELPELCRSFFPLSDAREDNFVAGLSMGGYGALKWALSKPDQFAAAASLSGAVNRARVPDDPERLREYRLIHGDESVAGTANDLFWLLQQCDASEGPKPKLYQCCGTEDFLYEDNMLFRNACANTDLDFTYEEGPGAHEWGYWDEKIQDVLAWLPLKRLRKE